MTLRELLVELPIALLAIRFFFARVCSYGSLHAHLVFVLRAGLRSLPSYVMVLSVVTRAVLQAVDVFEARVGMPLLRFTLLWLGGDLTEAEQREWESELFVAQLYNDRAAASFYKVQDIRAVQLRLRMQPRQDYANDLYNAATRLGVNLDDRILVWLLRNAEQSESIQPVNFVAPPTARRTRAGGGGAASKEQLAPPISPVPKTAALVPRVPSPSARVPSTKAGRAPPQAPSGNRRTANPHYNPVAATVARPAPVGGATASAGTESDIVRTAVTGVRSGAGGAERSASDCPTCRELRAGRGGGAPPASLCCGHALCAACAGRLAHCPLCDARIAPHGPPQSQPAPRAAPPATSDVVDD